MSLIRINTAKMASLVKHPNPMNQGAFAKLLQGYKWPSREDLWFNHFRGIVCVSAADKAESAFKMGKLVGHGGQKLKDHMKGLDILWISHVDNGSTLCGTGDYDSYFDIVGPTQHGVEAAVELIKQLMKDNGFKLNTTKATMNLTVTVDNAAQLHQKVSSVMRTVAGSLRKRGGVITSALMMHGGSMNFNVAGLSNAQTEKGMGLGLGRYKTLGKAVVKVSTR